MALIGADLLEPARAACSLVLPGLEEHPHPVASRRGKLDPKLLAFLAEEAVGDLGEYPLPVVPLCSRLCRTSRPSSTVSRVLRPSSLATNPSPQASCSYIGS
jgi:hypothetical protein